MRNSFLYESQEAIIEERTSELKISEEQLRYRLAFEELVTDISNRFINIGTEDIDREITASLQTIGEFLNTDRCHMNLLSDDMNKIEYVYEWHREGSKSTVENIKNLSTENASWIRDKFNKFEILSISSVENLGNEAKYEKGIWQSLGIKSIIFIPLKFGENGGFLGLNSERSEKNWKKEDLKFFRMIGEIFANVLERKRAEEEKKKLEESIRQSHKMEAIATMAGGISHDFNNMLGSIMGYTELAIDEVTENTRLHDYLTNILNSSLRVKNLIRQFLVLSHQQDWNKTPREPGTIIEDALNIIKSTLPSNIQVYQDIDRRGTVMLNPTNMHQVLFNLCSNSVHAMKENGGILTINLKYISSEKSLSYGDIKKGNYMKLMVSDTGCGMDSTIMERIFEPYFTTKKFGEGAGMGLPVVYGIIKKHGGEIRVKSHPGKGTEFNIFLPVNEYY
jgi:signal transduction histidine kinase